MDEQRRGNPGKFSLEEIIQIVALACNSTRNEDDFNGDIAAIIVTKPSDGWIFITDQLNTHKSESLVRLVATNCGINIDLGIKSKSGILHSMESRAAFLTDISHRIRFCQAFIIPSCYFYRKC